MPDTDLIDALQYSLMGPEQLRQAFGDFDTQEYEQDFPPIPSGTSQELSLQFKTDSLFVWEKSFFTAFYTGTIPTFATAPYPNARVQLQDQGSQRFLFSAPVYVSSVFGLTGFPLELPRVRYFEANTRLSFTVYNDSSPADLNIKFTLLGKKFFGRA